MGMNIVQTVDYTDFWIYFHFFYNLSTYFKCFDNLILHSLSFLFQLLMIPIQRIKPSEMVRNVKPFLNQKFEKKICPPIQLLSVRVTNIGPRSDVRPHV